METSRLVELGVLGFLAEESTDMRTVRERFEHNVGRYWNVSYGALVPALATLVDQFERARNRWMEIQDTHTDAIPDPPGYRREHQELNVRLYDTYLEWLGGCSRRQERAQVVLGDHCSQASMSSIASLWSPQ